MRNSGIHIENTRIADSFQILAMKSDLGKTGINCRGTVIRNIIIKDGINTDISQTVFNNIF